MRCERERERNKEREREGNKEREREGNKEREKEIKRAPINIFPLDDDVTGGVYQ